MTDTNSDINQQTNIVSRNGLRTAYISNIKVQQAKKLRFPIRALQLGYQQCTIPSRQRTNRQDESYSRRILLVSTTPKHPARELVYLVPIMEVIN